MRIRLACPRAIFLAALLTILPAAGRTAPLSSASYLSFDTPRPPYSAAIADFNGDGRPDLVMAGAGEVDDVSFGFASVMLGTGNGTFGPLTDFACGGGARYVAVADLNGDGRPDLAAASGYNTVSVLLGNGDGTFAPANDYYLGSEEYYYPYPVFIAIGDLNADGRPDLVAANSNSNLISILFGTGNGALGAHVDIVTGICPYSVAIADLDADGHADLAVVNREGTVSILLGTGDGTFATPTNFPVGDDPRSIAVADFSGDGRLDLAVANYGASSISVLLGDGHGSFGAKNDYPGGYRCHFIASADMNADGKVDLVTANFGDRGAVSVLLGDGHGTFTHRTDQQTGASPYSLAIADVDGDGHLDVVTADLDANDVAVLLGNGDGTLGARTTSVDGTSPLSLAIAGFRTNPAPGTPVLALTLADDSPARIEMFDVAGRRVFERDLQGLGAGRHAIPLDGARSLAPGVYMIQLRQAGQVRLARGVMIP